MKRTNKQINETLRKSAINSGLCEQWQQDWKQDWDNETLVKKFYEGIDFYMKTRFVTLQTMETLFPKEFLREHAIIVNDEYSLINPLNAIVTGRSISTIRVNARNVAIIYVCDNAFVTLAAKNNSYVMVHLYDKAKINAMKFDKAQICVIKHSTDADVITKDNITIYEKEEV